MDPFADRTPLAVILHLANVLLDIVGLVFFGAVVFTTVKQKNLHSACHLLIGLYSFCGFCSKAHTIVPFILANVPQIGGIPFYLCAIFHLLPVSIAFGTFPLMLSIGIDRVLAIYCSFWYSSRSNKKYFAIQFLFSTFYPLYICYIILDRVIKNPKMSSNCVGLDANSANTLLIFTYIVLTFCCYLLIFIGILARRNQEQTTSISQAIFKSLALIIFLQTFCWFCAIILINWLNNSSLNVDQYPIAMYSIFCFTSAFTTAEMPLLYFTSSDHRLALKKQFPRIFRQTNKISAVNNKILVTTVVNSKSPVMKKCNGQNVKNAFGIVGENITA